MERLKNGTRSTIILITHRVHLDFALSLEQHPADGHAHEVWSKSRPRFIVDFVEQRQRVIDAVKKKKNSSLLSLFFY